MSASTIYRGYNKTISFSLKDAVTKDPIDLTQAIDTNGGMIRYELVTPDLTITGTELTANSLTSVQGDPLLGKFDCVISKIENTASGLTKGSYTLQGQCDFADDRDPIEFSQQVLVKDLPV